jgi:hypothetical protein
MAKPCHAVGAMPHFQTGLRRVFEREQIDLARLGPQEGAETEKMPTKKAGSHKF